MLKPYFNKSFLECGLDEAGRGCLAGPVVASAVILSSQNKIKGLNDSKQLSKSQREELALEIKEKALAYSISTCSAQEIDEINILNASILAMHRCVDSLSTKPEHLLVDGNRFKPYIGIPHTCIVKGDAHFQSIAAASILAKTFRDELMLELSREFPLYGWDTNAGYPTIFHRKAILTHGTTIWHRKTFKVQLPQSLKE